MADGAIAGPGNFWIVGIREAGCKLLDGKLNVRGSFAWADGTLVLNAAMDIYGITQILSVFFCFYFVLFPIVLAHSNAIFVMASIYTVKYSASADCRYLWEPGELVVKRGDGFGW